MLLHFSICSFVNMLSMFVLMRCLDHLECYQPLGLDRIHQIANMFANRSAWLPTSSNVLRSFVNIFHTSLPFDQLPHSSTVLGACAPMFQRCWDPGMFSCPTMSSQHGLEFLQLFSYHRLPFEQTFGGAGGFRHPFVPLSSLCKSSSGSVHI